MIFEHIVEIVTGRTNSSNPHRSTSGIVGLRACDRPAGGFVFLIDSTHVNGLAAILIGFLDQVPIRVIGEGRGLPANQYRSQAVLGVEGALLSLSKCLGVGLAVFSI